MAASSNREKELFLAALDLASASERAAFLAEACGADEALRRQVEAMLKARDASDSFLEKPAAFALGATSERRHRPIEQDQRWKGPPREVFGTRVGPLQVAGARRSAKAACMASFTMAEQSEPVRRKVVSQDHQARHG